MVELYALKMGKDKMKKILENAGVVFETGIMTLLKEGGYQDKLFPPYVYEKFFEILALDGEEFVHFTELLPYLMIFFLFS